MWSRDEDEDPGLDIVLIHFETRTHFRPISMAVLWSWYDAISSWGIDGAHEMAIQSAKQLVAGELAADEHEHLRRMLEAIKHYVEKSKHQSKEDHVLWTSYEMLSRREWTRAQALRFAQNILDPAITADAWRRRVDRWGQRNNKSPLGFSRGRPTQDKNGHIASE